MLLNPNDRTTTKHLYNLGVMKDGVHTRIEVNANTRTSAASKAKKAGYEVLDVNMVG